MVYYLKLFSLGVFLIIIGFVLDQYTMGVVSNFFWGSILFVFVITAVGHKLLDNVKKKSPEKFTNTFLISTVVRFLIAGTTVLCLVVLLKDKAKLEILNFIAVYFCFLWFEIIHLSANLRAISNRELKNADESSI